MYGCDSWTIKKAEHQKTDAFELWCWRRLLRVPWTGWEIQPVHPKGDQSWVFIARTDVEAETPILWPQRADSFEKTLMLGKIEGRRRERQRMRWLDGITNSMDMGLGEQRVSAGITPEAAAEIVADEGNTNSPRHEPQHARPPCLSPTPGVHSNPCPLSW